MARNSSVDLCDDIWPPGFRFHPTDEELVAYYLKRKICCRQLKLDIIAEVDVYKWDPEDLPGLSMLKNGDRQWFFFSPRDRKYPNGSRSNRATSHGYWKATGKDRVITCSSRNAGIKKTLVFYKGRAPKGERTDWVMHEYTLEEDELKRCKNAQDYYAICKVFKKSGPGPKNGEHYGAPFREEDWIDDDSQEVVSNDDQVNLTRQLKNVRAADSYGNAQVNLSFCDVEEHMSRIADEPAPRPSINEFEQALSQFLGEEEAHSSMVNASFVEGIYAEPCTTYALIPQQNALEASINVMQSATSGLQMWDVPEVTSATASLDQHPHFAEDDFLEMDDLLGPQPIKGFHDILLPHHTGDSLPENTQWGEEDGLSEFDLFEDANAFLHDSAPIDQAILPASCRSSHESGLVNQIGFQLQSYQHATNSVGNEMWTYDANTFLPNTSESNQGSFSFATTGVVYAGVPTSTACEPNQNQSGKEVEVAQPWFSSTLWSFVESIPAAPASAAESALVNKAFQRMSSFSRVRLSAESTIAAAKGSSASGPTSAGVVVGRMKGFFVFSFLAAFFAVVCVFIGSNSSVFGKLHCRVNL